MISVLFSTLNAPLAPLFNVRSLIVSSRHEESYRKKNKYNEIILREEQIDSFKYLPLDCSCSRCVGMVIGSEGRFKSIFLFTDDPNDFSNERFIKSF